MVAMLQQSTMVSSTFFSDVQEKAGVAGSATCYYIGLCKVRRTREKCALPPPPAPYLFLFGSSLQPLTNTGGSPIKQ